MSTTHTTRIGAAARQAHEIVGAAGRATRRIDPATARDAFTIRKRLMFVKKLTVTGRFTNVSGTITLDGQEPRTAQAEVAIDAASVDTRNARRDKHLRAVDFLHAEEHPHLPFVSRRVEAVDRAAGAYRVSGDLTIRGVTRVVTLDAHDTPPVTGASEPRLTLTLAAPPRSA